MIANKFKILSKIGKGNFGNIYIGIYEKKQEKIAIKTENKNNTIQLLKHETSILNYMYGKGSKNTPFVYYFGVYKHHFTLIIPYYECSLKSYYDQYKSIDNWIIMMIEILNVIHNLGVIHRDIKPENFMIRNNNIFLIDFGLSTIYVDDNFRHVEENNSDSILGTPKFISIHIHNGCYPSRRDDIISLMYIFFYFKYGESLLWEEKDEPQYETQYTHLHILHPKNQKRKRLKEQFHNTLLDDSIEKKIFHYVYQIQYKEQPHYQWIISIFENL